MGSAYWVCGQGFVAEHFKSCFTVLVCGSGVGVKDIQMLYDTEFGWRAAPDQESQVLRIAPMKCQRQAGAGAGMLATQCLHWKLYDGAAQRQNNLPQAWANDLDLESWG